MNYSQLIFSLLHAIAIKDLDRNSLQHMIRSINYQTNMDSDQYNLLMLKGLTKIHKIATLSNITNRIVGIRRLRGTKDKDILRSFFHYGLSNLTSNGNWNVNRSEQRAGLLFSIHNEAYALLVIINNWSVWEQMALGVKRGISSPGKTLFTNKFVEVNDTSVCMKGWNNKGMKEFNEILNYLVTIRNDIEMINMETELMMEYKRFDEITPKKKEKKL